jgi:hypothetical protein
LEENNVNANNRQIERKAVSDMVLKGFGWIQSGKIMGR